MQFPDLILVQSEVSPQINPTDLLVRRQRVGRSALEDDTAMDNVCLHRGGPLGQGVIEKGKVVCPWHGWAWDPATGQAAHNPTAKLVVYPLKIENGDVMIDLESHE